MIKWIRGRLYHGHSEERITGHIFQCEEKSISFQRLGTGDYPPFDCLNLTLSEAIELRNWLNEIIIPITLILKNESDEFNN